MEYPHIGNLDRKLIIQTSFWLSKGDSGEQKTGWTKFAEVWGKAIGTGGAEALEAGQITDKENSSFVIRYLAGVKPKMRILYEGKFYNIRSVAEIGRKRFLLIKTESRDND